VVKRTRGMFMKIFSKIKHLQIGRKAIGILSSGKAKLSSMSKKNKRIVAGTASAIVIGLGGVGAAKLANHTPKLDKNTNSIVTENTTDNTDDNKEVYGPVFNGETPTDTEKDEKKPETKDEFLSDKVKDVKIKDNEDKTNKDVKEATNSDSKEEAPVGYVAYPESYSKDGEIVEKVEYSGNAVVVDGVAYESQEDVNRNNNVGSVEFEDNVQYYPGADGEYYLTQEDADNSYVEVYFDNNTNTDNNETGLSDGIQEGYDTYTEVTDDSFFYDDKENRIRWASYEEYLKFTNPSYVLEADSTELVDEETNVVDDEVADLVISDEDEEIVYGPDGEVYPSLEAYNEAMAKKIEEASVIEETKVEVKEETKEETKAEVKEETKEETKPEVKEETKEETKTEVAEETKEEVTEAKGDSEDDMYSDILLDDEGWFGPDGQWWASEEDYILVLSQNQEMAAKTR